jgi:uncharacterized protein YndB with AHSA1/START domain
LKENAMTEAAKSRFVYVTYIRTTPEQLWAALTTPEFMKKYWFGMNIETDWKTGSPWKLVFPIGRVADIGEIVEIEEPKRLILRWRNQFRPDLHEEGYARCTMNIGQEGEVVRLTITHEIDKPDSKLIDAVSIGWPKILSSLKTLLETGAALPPVGELPRS